MVGWILRTFRTLIIGIGCIIWMPTSKNPINFIESIQRRFTKMIDCFQSYDGNLQMPATTTSYHERLKMLNIYNSQRRKEQYAKIFTACTKPRTRNPLQSKYKSKSNTTTKHQQCITNVGKIQQYPCYFERARK